MATGPRYRVPFRRRRQGKTDYRARLALLKSHELRAVVRNSQSRIRVQFVEFDMNGDRTVASAVSSELSKFGWEGSCSSTPAAYLTGLLAGMRAKGKGFTGAVLDIGLHEPRRGAKVFASLKGMLDAGIEVPHGEGMFPSDERISGAHLGEDVPARFDAIRKKLGVSK